jgi:hypothetical protein
MYKVYWTGSHQQPCSEDFDDLGQALKHAQQMRECLMSFVTIVSEDPNSVGKPGVDSVIDGVLPDGNIYEWKMRRTQ